MGGDDVSSSSLKEILEEFKKDVQEDFRKNEEQVLESLRLTQLCMFALLGLNASLIVLFVVYSCRQRKTFNATHKGGNYHPLLEKSGESGLLHTVGGAKS